MDDRASRGSSSPPEVAVQAPPNLTERFRARCSTPASTTGAASRRSRSTTSTPRRRGRRSSCSARRRAEPRARACAAPHRLPALRRLASGSTRRAPARAAAADALGLAREDGWSPGETGDVPFVVRATRCPLDDRATSSARTSSCGSSARAARSGSACSRAADALRREVNGDEVTYVVTRNIQYTNVCYFRCGFCAFSKGKLAANLRGAPYLVPHEEIVAARGRGVGARRDRDLPPGRHPSRLRRRLLRLGRARDQGRRAGAARARVQRARDLAGRGDARRAARRVPRRACATRASPRCRARPPRSSTTRCGAIICPDKITTAQWLEVHDDRASGRAALERHDHVRPRRRPAQLGAPPARARASCSGGRAASPSSCRCRSCTWRRRSTCKGGARSRADVRRDAARCTPSGGSRCIRGSRTCRSRG